MTPPFNAHRRPLTKSSARFFTMPTVGHLRLSHIYMFTVHDTFLQCPPSATYNVYGSLRCTLHDRRPLQRSSARSMFYASCGWCFVFHIYTLFAVHDNSYQHRRPLTYCTSLTMPTVGHLRCLRLAPLSERHHNFSSYVARLINSLQYYCYHYRYTATGTNSIPFPHAPAHFSFRKLCRAPYAVLQITSLYTPF